MEQQRHGMGKISAWWTWNQCCWWWQRGGGASCSVLCPVLGLRFKTFCEVHGVLSGPGRDAPVQTVSIYISKGLNYFHLMIDEYFLPASYHHHQAVHLAPGSSNYRTLECCYLEGERGKNTTRCSPLICILTQSTQSWAKQMILLNSNFD